MEKIEHCPICGTKLREHITVPDYYGTNEQFKIHHCKTCHLQQTNPQPDPHEIIKYYKSNSYVSHGDSKGSIFDLVYKVIQSRNHHYKLKLIQKYSLSKTLLDYGAGNGSFANYMSDNAYEVTAIEPDENAREQISNTTQSSSSIESVHQSFDIITSFHVLEHVHDLNGIINKFKSMLTRNGIVILALPNYLSYDAQLYGEYWAGYDVPRHLHHFTQKSVIQLAGKFGLNLVGIHPLKFDSYYVSLLSEQYKKSKFAPAKAAYRGWLSNRKAKQSGEYSSLIYILTA